MPWYALHVRPSQEHLVELQLAQLDLESFYPHITNRSKDKRRDVELKFMPGYVFSRFDMATRTPVVRIPQVVSIIGIGTHAVAIPDVEIEAVRKIVSFPKLVMPCEFVPVGKEVEVLAGPLKGLRGIVAYHKNSTRVIVSIAMLARSISAEVDADSLRLLEPLAA